MERVCLLDMFYVEDVDIPARIECQIFASGGEGASNHSRNIQILRLNGRRLEQVQYVCWKTEELSA